MLWGQAQLREEKLKEENDAFENAISNCEDKIKERLQEAELLRSKLEVGLRIVICILYCVMLNDNIVWCVGAACHDKIIESECDVLFGGLLSYVFWELKFTVLCFKYIWFFCFGLQEMDEAEERLKTEIENMRLRASENAGQSWTAESWEEENKTYTKTGFDADVDGEVSKSAMLDKLEEKKNELVCCFFNHTILFCILNHNILFNNEWVRVHLDKQHKLYFSNEF